MNISVDENTCVGCSICEMACSFHHNRDFLPDKSSMRIYFDDEGGLNIVILPTCDLCVNERIPLCVEFCPSRAVKLTESATETT
jgi:Fe-S-cluster-containing dehydrogenase component